MSFMSVFRTLITGTLCSCFPLYVLQFNFSQASQWSRILKPRIFWGYLLTTLINLHVVQSMMPFIIVL